jgi:2-polyprenyl-6-methoxyphenol hydroxylase-like FAD-dependent oxidoreductase
VPKAEVNREFTLGIDGGYSPPVKQVQVLIAGGGPVGMTLARDLARRDVSCMLIERNPGTTRHPKMDITNVRSMELFRRLALAEELRTVGVPESSNFDVSWITSLSGHELHRFRYPSVTEWRRMIHDVNDGSMPAEPPMRVSQVEIEPVLQRSIQAEPRIDARWGVTFDDLAQDAEGVTATLRTAGGGTEQVRCSYLVGCDGGNSRVRGCVDIRLQGQSRVAQRFMTHFRSRAVSVLQRWGVTWHYQSPAGTLIAQNDRDTWTLHTRWLAGVAPEAVDPHALLRGFTGCDFDYEILVANAWTPHLLVAESYGVDRIFLAGDAAHQYVPTGGYGMNTGIGDACDLGWKLAAVLHGFGGQRLLASYEIERRPVGLRNLEASGRHSEVRAEIAALYLTDLTASGSHGDTARAEAGQRIAAIGNAENESFGIELGYAYPDSPIICSDPGAEIPSDPLRYVPTTVPGARMPSMVMGDGTQIFDRLGPWFTLACFGARPSEALVAAAAKRGLPMAVIQSEEPHLAKVYGRGLLLVRPDQHIAWRGSACDSPRAADAIIAGVLGWEAGTL